MIKLDQLHYLLELNKTESFRQCAEKLHCSQPAISLAIKNLENELGVELITRTPNSIKLTEIGENVVKQAKEIWSNVADIYLLANEDAIEKAKLTQSVAIEEVSFYAPETTLSSILPTVLLRLQKQHLEMKISTYESKPERTLEELNKNSNVIGLHYFWENELKLLQKKHPHLNIEPICELNYFLVVADCATFDLVSEINLDTNITTVEQPFPMVMYGRSGNITWDIMEILVDNHHAELVFKAPEEKMFFDYIKHGFAAGLIMQYGDTKPLKRNKNRDQYHFIPLKTNKPSYFCCLSNKKIHPKFYRRIFEYIQFSVDFL